MWKTVREFEGLIQKHSKYFNTINPIFKKEFLIMENVNQAEEFAELDWREKVMEKITELFLSLCVSLTLIQRVFSLVLLCADVPVKKITKIRSKI